MSPADLTIAKKHIEISMKAKHIADISCQNSRTYIATYTTGGSGQSYQRIEQESGGEFWSIKCWTPPPRSRLKDPDLIITHDRQVKILVEVKWGAVPGRAGTDLLVSPEEMGKMARLLSSPAMCRVRGPAVKGGHRYRSPEFPIEEDYWTDSNTRFFLVTDFLAMRQVSERMLQESLKLWGDGNVGFLLADISTRVGGIPSFQELVHALA